jgi:hypothetical protein
MEIAKIILEYLKVTIWPITTFILLLIFKKDIGKILLRLKKADLPGGISLETFPEQIEEAKSLLIEVKEEKKEEDKLRTQRYATIPLTEANAKMITLGLSPSPSGLELDKYKQIAEQDPNLALAGLRIELEIMLKNLAKGYNLDINKTDSITRITNKLKVQNSITKSQSDLIHTIINLANAAVHGVKVTKSQANDILQISETLRDHYINWLSWGFPNK